MSMYLTEFRFELLRTLRQPGFVLPSLGFPLIFYWLFGLTLGFGGSDFDMSRYLLGTYGVFGIMGPALFGFGMFVATEAEDGTLMAKRTTPLSGAAYLFAKGMMALCFACMILLGLRLLAGWGGVALTAGQTITWMLTLLLGTVPFAGLGLLIGTMVRANVAPAIVNLIYLPMAVLSGLWFPLQLLPDWLAALAPLWPAWHLAQLSLQAVGGGEANAVLHIGVLVGYSVVLFGVASWQLRRRFGLAL